MFDAKNTILGGLGFTSSEEARKVAVWVKGHVIPGYDSTIWRRDDYGHTLRYADHGNRNSKYGWEKDHIVPVCMGGGDEIANLRPLRCATNAGLGGLLGAALKR